MLCRTEKKEGVSISQLRNKNNLKSVDLLNEFKKEVGDIYDKYRSPFIHQGKFLNPVIKARTKIFGNSVPGFISLQDFAKITLDVMKLNFKLISKTLLNPLSEESLCSQPPAACF